MSLLLSCDCKTVSMTVSSAPVACAYCHCATCREVYGVTLLAATAWSEDCVKVSAGRDHLAEYRHPTKQMRRCFCTRCGEILFGRNRLGKMVIKNALVAKSSGGRLPPELHPKFHLFYGAREIDVYDELPKYIDGWDGPLFSGHTGSRGE